jgi:hypothetical protein
MQSVVEITKLYIASRFRNKPWISEWVKALPSKYSVVSTWHTLPDDADGTHAEAVARDIREIDECDAIVVVSHNCEQTPGGLHFEAGYAFAKGKRLFLCGPSVNIFLECLAQPTDYGFYSQEPPL